MAVAAPLLALLPSASTAAMIAGGVGAAGSLMSGISAYKTGQVNQQAANSQAIETQQAATERAQQQQTETSRQIGQLTANAGASGVDPNQGSPLAARGDLAIQGSLNQALTRWQGTTQAQALRYQGNLSAAQGQSALFGNIASGAGSLLTGIWRSSQGGSGGVGPKSSTGYSFDFPTG